MVYGVVCVYFYVNYLNCSTRTVLKEFAEYCLIHQTIFELVVVVEFFENRHHRLIYWVSQKSQLLKVCKCKDLWLTQLEAQV